MLGWGLYYIGLVIRLVIQYCADWDKLSCGVLSGPDKWEKLAFGFLLGG